MACYSSPIPPSPRVNLASSRGKASNGSSSWSDQARPAKTVTTKKAYHKSIPIELPTFEHHTVRALAHGLIDDLVLGQHRDMLDGIGRGHDVGPGGVHGRGGGRKKEGECEKDAEKKEQKNLKFSTVIFFLSSPPCMGHT